MSKPTTLIDRDGTLYLGDILLIHRYRSGDADTVNWPNPNVKLLARCLYDEREQGNIEGNEVTLPDGSTLEF